MSYVTLTKAQFETVWNQLEMMRDDVSSLEDLAEALTVVGLTRPASRLRSLEHRISKGSIIVQDMLVEGQADAPASPLTAE